VKQKRPAARSGRLVRRRTAADYTHFEQIVQVVRKKGASRDRRQVALTITRAQGKGARHRESPATGAHSVIASMKRSRAAQAYDLNLILLANIALCKKNSV
jgi:hypothetical protein